MPAFRTEISVPRHPVALRHTEPIFLLGSCFSDGIGRRLLLAGHDALVNPFGTLYNPVSIRNTLCRLATGEGFDDEDILWDARQEHFYSFDTSTTLTRPSHEELAADLSAAASQGQAQLERCAAVVLTLGSAWAYSHRASGRIVANCHRQPQAEFERTLLSPTRIVSELDAALEAVRAVNPEARVVLTVSPVRHWKEGAIETSCASPVSRTERSSRAEFLSLRDISPVRASPRQNRSRCHARLLSSASPHTQSFKGPSPNCCARARRRPSARLLLPSLRGAHRRSAGLPLVNTRRLRRQLACVAHMGPCMSSCTCHCRGCLPHTHADEASP